jgi:hypothetical protein
MLLRLFARFRKIVDSNGCFLWIPLLLFLNSQTDFDATAFNPMVVQKHYFVDSLLRQRSIVFVVILIAISVNNIGRHLIDLLDAATKTEASNIRNVDKTSRLGLTVIIMLALHGRRKRSSGTR